MIYTVRMRKISIHEFELKAGSYREALRQCHKHCMNLNSSSQVGLLFEVENITGERNDNTSQRKQQTESTVV